MNAKKKVMIHSKMFENICNEIATHLYGWMNITIVHSKAQARKKRKKNSSSMY
jgi:hypothetical protein